MPRFAPSPSTCPRPNFKNSAGALPPHNGPRKRPSRTERAYPKLVHYGKLDKGGHFPAWEQPKLFVEELRAGLRSLRK